MSGSRSHVLKDWDWDDSAAHIQAAATQDIARTLLRIEASLNSLGADGLHTLIQLAVKNERRRERLRLARAKKAK